MGQTISKLATDPVRMGPVTRARVNARTRELALLAGRAPPHVTQSDYEQAKREVTGESEINRQEVTFEAPAISLLNGGSNAGFAQKETQTSDLITGVAP